MGECLISRRGGEAYSLPILDVNYPKDVTTTASLNGTVSFSIAISEHGKPVDYTYQWYVNGEAVSGAVNSNYTRSTTANDVGTFAIYCSITNKAGTISSRVATLVVKSAIPTTYSFDGLSELQKDSEYDWTLYLKSSGTLVLPDDYNVDLFLYGGGGAGGGNNSGSTGGAGGAGGYQTTQYNQTIASGSYTITIGGGGTGTGGTGGTGGTTTAFGFSAAGGTGGKHHSSEATTGGTGSGGGGGWYWDGGNTGYMGTAGSNGKQAFGTGTIFYCAGGGGGACKTNTGCAGGTTGGGKGGDHDAKGNAATANTGSGGGGAGGTWNSEWSHAGGNGGSGGIIIRNVRG